MGCASTKNTVEYGFSKAQIQLINTADSLTPMRVFKITNKKDSLLLRTQSRYVKANPKVFQQRHAQHIDCQPGFK